MASMLSRLTGVAVAISVGCATNASVTNATSPGGSKAALDPIAFFTGQTRGEGELDTLLSSPVKVFVDSVGRRDGDTLTLDQTIREGRRPARVRRWMMRRTEPNRYVGTLTDATGAVHITVTGPNAHISYNMKGGLGVRQQLTLQSDGRTLLNRLQVRKFGLPVATLEETIRKLD